MSNALVITTCPHCDSPSSRQAEVIDQSSDQIYAFCCQDCGKTYSRGPKSICMKFDMDKATFMVSASMEDIVRKIIDGEVSAHEITYVGLK